MIIGAMNHPARDPFAEIRWMAEMGLGFIDLTLEPPAAAPWQVDAPKLRQAIEDAGLQVVGHTAYYLPVGHPFDLVRRAAVEHLQRCLELFAELGARWMNVHPDGHAPFHERAFIVERNLASFGELTRFAAGGPCGVMVENVPGSFNQPGQLGELLDPLPELGLHLDIGHCNLKVEANTTAGLVARFGDRLKHVHLHDNKGGSADLHLPLGSGTLDVEGSVRSLKASGYDYTITLEVFTRDPHYFAYSRDTLQRLWDAL
jgi:sugar phosphate isomerase/epimerase